MNMEDLLHIQDDLQRAHTRNQTLEAENMALCLRLAEIEAQNARLRLLVKHLDRGASLAELKLLHRFPEWVRTAITKATVEP